MAVSPMRAALALLLIAAAANHAAAQTVTGVTIEQFNLAATDNTVLTPTAINITDVNGVGIRIIVTGTGFNASSFDNAPTQLTVCTNMSATPAFICDGAVTQSVIDLDANTWTANSTATRLIGQFTYRVANASNGDTDVLLARETGLQSVSVYTKPFGQSYLFTIAPGTIQGDGVNPNNVVLTVDNSTATTADTCTNKKLIPVSVTAADNWSPLYVCFSDVSITSCSPSTGVLMSGQSTAAYGPRTATYTTLYNTSTLPLLEGTNTFYTVVSDAAGNYPAVTTVEIKYSLAPVATAFTYTIDKSVPTTDAPTATGTITISGSTDAYLNTGTLCLGWTNVKASCTVWANLTTAGSAGDNGHVTVGATSVIDFKGFPLPSNYVQGGYNTLYAWVTDACGSVNSAPFTAETLDNDVPEVQAAVTASGTQYLVPIQSLILNKQNLTELQKSLQGTPWWGSFDAAKAAAAGLIAAGKKPMNAQGVTETTIFPGTLFVYTVGTITFGTNFTLVGAQISADGLSVLPTAVTLSGDAPATLAFDEDALGIYWESMAAVPQTLSTLPAITTFEVDGEATDLAATNEAQVSIKIVATPSNLAGEGTNYITAFCVSDTTTCGTFIDIDYDGNSTGTWTGKNTGTSTGTFTWVNPAATTNGPKAVYVYVRDSYGVANVAAPNNTYMYETQAPISSVKFTTGVCAPSTGIAPLTIDAADNYTIISYCQTLNTTTGCLLPNDFTVFPTPAQPTFGYRNATEVTTFTVPAAGAVVTTYVIDAAGNAATPVATAVRVASASGPSGTALINGGAAQTQTSLVTINLNATNVGAGDVEVCVQASSNVTECAWQAYAAALPYEIPLTPSNVSQTATVNVWFKDSCDSVSAVVTDSIILLAGTVPTTPIGVITVDNQTLVMLETQGNPDTQNFQAPFQTFFYPSKENARVACLLTASTDLANNGFATLNVINGTAYGPLCAYAPPARRRLLVAAGSVMPVWAPYLNGSTIALAAVTTTSNTTNVYYVSQASLDPSTVPVITALTVPATAGALAITVNLTATPSLGAQINGYCASDSSSACTVFQNLTANAPDGGFSGSVPVTLTSGGVRTVSVWVKDSNGFVSDPATGTVSVSTGAPFVNSAVVTPQYSTGVVSIAVVATSSANTVIQDYCITESVNATCTTWTPVTGWTINGTAAAGTATYTLIGANGPKTLFVTVRNSASVPSTPAFPVTPAGSPVFDNVAPSVTSVSASTVCGNVASTNVVIGASDNMSPISFCAASSAAAAINCSSWTLAPGQAATGARNVSFTLTVPTPAASGPVYVAVKDAAGNVVPTAVSANVSVCLLAPTLNLVVALNLNPPQTPTTNIQAFIVPPTGVVALSYCISKNPACIPTIPWNNGSYVDITLDAVSGSQTVYGRLRTAGGDTAPAEQSIIFNTAAEPLGYLLSSTSAINPPYTTSTALTLKTVGGVAPPGFMCVTDKTKPCKPNKPYAESFAFKLSGKQELKTVTPYYGIKNDKNPKAGIPFTITYDKTPPKMSKSKLAFTWTVSGGDGVVGFQDTATDSVSGMTVPGTYKMVWGAKTPKAKCVDGTALTIDVGTGLARSADIAGVTDPKSVKVRLCAIDKAGNVASGITYAPK